MKIREIKTIQELEQVQQLEWAVWGTATIPVHQTLTAVKNGGIVVGAFDQDKLIGFSYGFGGFKHGKSYLCSHMLGIDENYRSKGIGEALKYAQRDIAIEKGYTMMLWTYDPLETRNGYLNLTKLHAICDTYVENCYGEMQDGLNKGLPSDRLEVNWYLTSDYAKKKQQIELGDAKYLGNVTWNAAGLPILTALPVVDQFTEQAYIVPVPKDFQDLKTIEPDLAYDWRMKTRQLFKALFAQNYVAIRLEQDEKMNKYIFILKQQHLFEGA
ncbi:GNAT family N-acetyltransferase [Solibacillus sp. FSL H8-0538]|uniref:GNAT family N-acetyltransferase n=1 Tax=Solibacillus sp. FSL H8-0538 TaxID=2921400 RepID=UPI0030F99381